MTASGFSLSKSKSYNYHSPFVLDGLDELSEMKRLLVVSRNSDGYTVVNQIKGDKSRSIPLSEAWLKGYIGGLPNNF